MEPVQNSNAPITVFYSYARKDKLLRDRLAYHLKLLEKQGYIASWSDQDVKPGQEWSKEKSKMLASADIILLLVSHEFIATNYCESTEVDIALQRHEAGEAWVIPILLRSVDWETSAIGKLQALPYDLKPVALCPDRDKAFTEISKNIRSLVMDLQKERDKETNNKTDDDTTPPPDRTVTTSRKKKKRDLYKTINADYSIGEKMKHYARIIKRNFSLHAANKRSKGLSLILLFLFAVLEILALPLIIYQLIGNFVVVTMSFIFSSLLFGMGVTGKNNMIAVSITLLYCAIWTAISDAYLNSIYHLHVTILQILLLSVGLSSLQLSLFYTPSHQKRLPFFPKNLGF
ncbi:hypothetical protein KSF_084040 [Reticulibacter mediterranei]|uniref:TIR domain-containing protein n=1 Tax=Reticulibacter mediterranei TaxID=2778369 RepID=A0A8J3IYF3_9CHLR|nr:toll/interleukin-1 receptor domain-containing protein [Reticulibacter mediterranei]GHO98356.1 hypothetical protein KSF_084040 [Reticulibacter mediterranei]